MTSAGEGLDRKPVDEIVAQDILHSLSQAVFVVGADNCILDVYAQAEAIFERSRESLIGASIGQIRGIGTEALNIVARSRDENTPLNSYDVSVVPPIGDIELMDLHAHPYGSEGATLLTAQPRRITAFLEKRDHMEAAARSVSGLASMLAHEIKNPLSGIRGAAQLMGRALDDKNIKLTELICKEVDRIKGLVDELETFSNPSQAVLEPVNIHEVLDHVLNVAVAGFGAKCIFRPRFDPSLPPVAGLYDRLVQIFLNLIKNAVEAAGAEADITITTSYRHGIWITGRSGERIRLPIEIAIHDSGPGIPDHLKGHLFDPFVSGKEGGTGLGLALVARYVSEMGGTVTCDNHPHGGAVFRIQLALHEDAK
ncbi:two-component system, NtrC family, nitrogen regulation sensor histidine kinase GlnL [Kordiimonas lacus]|uniref:histidine kinase n=1 Tax=Kordiimonas lacus TaxID=637679 RepID=A0A1G6WGS6_9PROT|nr:two-component system, NtrC family, nitrogen regulation sensor histidine kinase GlnL [Kordiimonas lacus]